MLIPRLYVDVLPPTLYTGYACNTSGLKFSPGHGGRKINHRKGIQDLGGGGGRNSWLISRDWIWKNLVLLFDFIVNMELYGVALVGKDFERDLSFLNPFDFS